MNTHQILSVVVLIAVFAGTSEAVKCWKCDKSTTTADSKKKCDDVDTLSETNDLSDCASGLMCKRSVKGDMIKLSCQTNEEKDYTAEACYKNKKDAVCYCNDDKCNGAADSVPALLLITMASFATIFFMH